MSVIDSLKDVGAKLKDLEGSHTGELAKITSVVEEVHTGLHEAEDVAQTVIDAIDHVALVVYAELSRLTGVDHPTNAPITPANVLPDVPSPEPVVEQPEPDSDTPAAA